MQIEAQRRHVSQGQNRCVPGGHKLVCEWGTRDGKVGWRRQENERIQVKKHRRKISCRSDRKCGRVGKE